MNADLKKLIRLQAVDIEIGELRAKTEAFPARSKALDDQLSAAESGVKSAEEAIQANTAARKKLETRVADIGAKVSKYRDQLMTVKTNDEYRAMVKEIEYSQAAARQEEDQILALMEQSEELEAALKAARVRLDQDQETVQGERKRLEELNATDQGALEAYLRERQELEKEVTSDVLSRYEKVRKLRGGVALATASDEACGVCNVRMRPQSFQEVRKNESIISCDSCGRILYAPDNLDHPFEVA